MDHFTNIWPPKPTYCPLWKGVHVPWVNFHIPVFPGAQRPQLNTGLLNSCLRRDTASSYSTLCLFRKHDISLLLLYLWIRVLQQPIIADTATFPMHPNLCKRKDQPVSSFSVKIQKSFVFNKMREVKLYYRHLLHCQVILSGTLKRFNLGIKMFSYSHYSHYNSLHQ